MFLYKFTNFIVSCLIPKSSKPTIKVLKLVNNAKLPEKAHINTFEDAAYDLFNPSSILLQPNERQLIGTKLRFIIPDGFWIKLRERSGLANKGIHVLGGVIDCGYTGEIKVILYNSGKDPVLISEEHAICQFTIEKLNVANIIEVSDTDFETLELSRTRGKKGFGSTDVKNR